MINLADFKSRLVEASRNKAAGLGLRALRVALKRLDKNNNGIVDPIEFKYGLRNFGIELDEDECAHLLKNLDLDRTGKISPAALLELVREGNFNAARHSIVEMAYNTIKGGNLVVVLDDLAANYDPMINPEVVYGVKSPQQVYDEFLGAWDS